MPARCMLSRRWCVARAGAAHAGMKRSLLRSRIDFARRAHSGHPRAQLLRSIGRSVWQRHSLMHITKLARLTLDSTSLLLPEQDSAFRLVVLLLADRFLPILPDAPCARLTRAHATSWLELPAPSSLQRTPEALFRFSKRSSSSAECNRGCRSTSSRSLSLGTDIFLTRNMDSFPPSSDNTFPTIQLRISGKGGLGSQLAG